MNYDVKSAVLHYGRSDEKEWRDPPHVYFANLNLESDTVLMFEKVFGPICGLRPAALPTSLEEGKVGQEVRIVRDADLAEAKIRQHILREAWAGDGLQVEHVFTGFGNVRGDTRTYGPVELVAAFSKSAIHLFTNDMWGFIRLAFQRDCLQGKTYVCANPDCLSPYSIAIRKTRKFCCKRCLTLINVRRFREREKELAGKKLHKITRKQSKQRQSQKRKRKEK